MNIYQKKFLGGFIAGSLIFSLIGFVAGAVWVADYVANSI